MMTNLRGVSGLLAFRTADKTLTGKQFNIVNISVSAVLLIKLSFED
jgi:hypothetical protein